MPNPNCWISIMAARLKKWFVRWQELAYSKTFLKWSITAAVVKSTKLPVTVKTRLGWDEHSIYIEEVAERLQDVGIKALSIHGRTRSQMYKGHADWTNCRRKNNPRIHIPIFGNGDIDSPLKAKEYKEKYGIDGIMIGRAAIGHPWIFSGNKTLFGNRWNINTTNSGGKGRCGSKASDQ